MNGPFQYIDFVLEWTIRKRNILILNFKTFGIQKLVFKPPLYFDPSVMSKVFTLFRQSSSVWPSWLILKNRKRQKIFNSNCRTDWPDNSNTELNCSDLQWHLKTFVWFSEFRKHFQSSFWMICGQIWKPNILQPDTLYHLNTEPVWYSYSHSAQP